MFKKNQETIIRFGFFLIIWIIIILFLVLFINPIFSDAKSGRGFPHLLWVFLMFPALITNIIQNIDNLNLFDSSYFWTFNLGSNNLWIVSFYLFAGIYFSIILTLLSGDNERIKNIIWKFHFVFFTYAIILLAVHDYIRYREDPTRDVVIGRVI